MKIKLSEIHPSPNPVRKTWDEGKLDELAQSISEQGLIVPIKVRPNSGGYEIVYGHRRVAACRIVGEIEIESFVEGVDDDEYLIQALLENIQREDMNAYDKGAAILDIRNIKGWSGKEIARRGIADEEGQIRWVGYKMKIDEGLAIASPSDDMVMQVREIRRAKLGNLEAEQKIIDKAYKENLNYQDTRAAADAYKQADSPELKQKVLETSGKLGDADRILESARMKLGSDAAVDRHESERRKAFEEYDQAVKDFIDAAKLFDRMVKTARNASKYGKFSPEGAQFTVRKIDQLINELEELKGVLQDVS